MRIVHDIEDPERIRGLTAAAARFNDDAINALPIDERDAYVPISPEDYAIQVLNAAADSWAKQYPAEETPEAVKIERDVLRQDKARLEAEKAELQRQLDAKTAGAVGADLEVKP